MAVALSRSARFEAARVLVVEDDPGVATLERRRLQRAGYPNAISRSAEEAMERLGLGDIDLVVLDHGLPGITGLELYEAPKEKGRSDEATIITALRDGVHDLIAESPEYLDYLPGAVERVLGQVRVARRLEESEDRFRNLIENLHVGVILVGPHGGSSLCNQSVLDLLGAEEEHLLGRTVFDGGWDVVRENGSRLPNDESPIALSVATGRGVRSIFDFVHPEDAALAVLGGAPGGIEAGIVAEFRFRHSDGSWRLMEASGTDPIGGPSGRGKAVDSREITARKALEGRLGHQAFHDSLPCLPIRALFMDRLGHALERKHRGGTECAVLDMDDFKDLDGSLGYEAGDELLAAKRIEGCLRPELLRWADAAIYGAKAGGRVHHAVFRPRMGDLAQDRPGAGSDLRRAQERGKLAPARASHSTVNRPQRTAAGTTGRRSPGDLGTVRP